MNNDWNTIRAALLADPAAKNAYDKLSLQYEVAEILVDMRIRDGLTQQQMAKRLHISQSAIARYESGRYNPSIKFLEKVAAATGYKVVITLEKI